MKKYETEQRKQILKVLCQHVDHQFYIEELEEALKKKGPISRSAIYRNIRQMVEEGVVKKFASKTSRKSLYQYFDNGTCAHHIHLKCSVCGQIFHLDYEASTRITQDVLQANQFQLEAGSCVLYGACQRCSC